MFCPNCKGLMQPGADGPVCPKCGTHGEGQTVTQEAEEKELVTLTEDEMATLPTTTDFTCEECGHREHYFVYRQTRAADEQTTIILQCTKCKHKWRKY